RTHSERMPRGQAGRCQTPLRTVVLEETVWTGCLTPIWATWGFAAKTCLVGRSLTPTWPHGTPAAWGFAPRRAALQLRILRARACRRGLVGQLERGEPPQGAEGAWWRARAECSGQVLVDSEIGSQLAVWASKAMGDRYPNFECKRERL